MGDPAEFRFGDSGFGDSGRTRTSILSAIGDDFIQEPTPMNKAVNVMVVCELVTKYSDSGKLELADRAVGY